MLSDDDAIAVVHMHDSMVWRQPHRQTVVNIVCITSAMSV